MAQQVTTIKKTKNAHFNIFSPDTPAFDRLFSIISLLYNHQWKKRGTKEIVGIF